MKLVPESNEHIQSRIAEARQLSVAAPIIFPLLERRRIDAYQRLLASYRDGKPTDQNQIAILFVIDSLMREISSKLEDLNLKKE